MLSSQNVWWLKSSGEPPLMKSEPQSYPKASAGSHTPFAPFTYFTILSQHLSKRVIATQKVMLQRRQHMHRNQP
mgnify:CR=1 FL=1